MEDATLCQELALAWDDGPCCWCCTPCQTEAGGKSCCCATGTCTQPCCVPREHEFAGELWFQEQPCDTPKPRRKTGLLEVPRAGNSTGGSLDGSAKLGVLRDGGPLSSCDTNEKVAGCCSGKRSASRMGPEGGAVLDSSPAGGPGMGQKQGVYAPQLQRQRSDVSVFEGTPQVKENLQVCGGCHTVQVMKPVVRAEPLVAPAWEAAPQTKVQRGFGPILPEVNYLLERPCDEKVVPPAPDGALAHHGAVAGLGGIAYPLPMKGRGLGNREIISNLRVPDSKAPANRFMYAQVFNGTTFGGAQPPQPGGASTLAGILDSTPMRILRKAAGGKETTAGLSFRSKKSSMMPPQKGVTTTTRFVSLHTAEKGSEQGGPEKLAKLTPSAVLAGTKQARSSQLPEELLLEVKRKSCASPDPANKRPKLLTPVLVPKPSDNSLTSAHPNPTTGSNSSTSSSDEMDSSGYDPSTVYRVTSSSGAVPSNGGFAPSLPEPLETPLPRVGSTSDFAQVKDLPFSPESFEGRCCKSAPEGVRTKPVLQVVPEGGAVGEEVVSPGSTGSGIVAKGGVTEGAEIGPRAGGVGMEEHLKLFRGLQAAKVQGASLEVARTLKEAAAAEASSFPVGSLTQLSDTPDILLKVLTSGLSARDLARLEAACRFFRTPANFAPDASMSLTVVAAHRSCQAHPVYKACSAASQGRLLLRCGGDWKVAYHHLNALDRVDSTKEGLVEVGPDFSCTVNTAGELRIFGGSKARFACLGEREVEQLWEQRRVGDVLADRKIACVAAGPGSVVTVTSEGDVYSFGKNEQGCLGIPGQEDVVLPQPVTALAGIPIAQVACGATVTAFLSREGRVYTSGTSATGMLGHGPETHFSDVPLMVQALSDVRIVQISAGWDHMLAVTDKGEVYAWGEGGKGQLGQGGTEPKDGGDGSVPWVFRCEETPQRIARLADHFDAHIVQVAAGAHHSVALAADGRVFLWGIPPNGIRSRDAREEDAMVQELRGIDNIRPVQVAAGALTTFVVGDLGEVYSFGCCFYGELGLEGWGLVTLEPRRVEVLRPHKIVQIAASWFRHTVARTFKGEVVVMGLNSSGQLGIPFTEAHAGVWKPRVIGRNCPADAVGRD